MGEDDFFSDDELDNIPANTLNAIESEVSTSTQALRQDNALHPASSKQAHNASSFNKSGVGSKNPPWRPPQRSQQPPTYAGPTASAPDRPSSDYGLDEEDVIDLDEPSLVVQPASGLPTRGNGPQQPPAGAHHRHKPAPDTETEAAFAAADEELAHQMGEQWAQPSYFAPKTNGNADLTVLQARITELESEQERLREAAKDASDAALAKQGEIAIVRANQDRANKEYERRIAVMQKMHQDETMKQKAEIEASKKERDKMETDNRFLQHDLAQEAERTKQLNGPAKARSGRSRQNDTPAKAKRPGVGDGFADDEMLLAPSPSKSKDKSRDHTPKAGSKRKRQTQDSPVVALHFTQPPETLHQDSGQTIVPAEPPVARMRTEEDRRYSFMQSVLNYRPYADHERTIEALTKYYFPSSPKASLSAAFFDGLGRQPSKDPVTLQVARTLLELWSHCLREKYYGPLILILDMIRFALNLELPSVISNLVERAVPVCLHSIELVLAPRARASKSPTFAASVEYKSQQLLASQIQVGEVLDFLLELAQASTLSSERNETFWKHLDLTSTLLLFHKAHPMEQVIVALQILSTSITTTSFGAISNEPQLQAKQELDTADRLTGLLFEVPDLPEGQPEYDEEEVAELRVETLKVLRAMCLTDHGSLILAQHRSIIGRLPRFLDGQVRKLYTLPPSIGRLQLSDTPGAVEPSAHDLVIQTVNMTVRIIYHLLKTFNDSIDLSQKLNAVHGGYHKFLVSLTRIAFTEQLAFEHGIEPEVVDAAQAILDNVLSPEEGEAVVKAVETPRGTRSTSKSAAKAVLGDKSNTNTENERTMNDAPG